MSGSADLRSRARAQGKRVTPQRQLILDAIRVAGGHVTPNEIFRRVSAKSPAVNRSTVYRNLDFLCEMRLVVAAQISGKMHYEIAGVQPHHHLVCRNCDSVEEISHQTVKNHMTAILRKLAVNDRTQAVVYAMRQGWIKMPED